MHKFKDPAHTQKLLSVMRPFLNLFKIGWYKHSAPEYRAKLQETFQTFDHIVSSHHHFAKIYRKGEFYLLS